MRSAIVVLMRSKPRLKVNFFPRAGGRRSLPQCQRTLRWNKRETGKARLRSTLLMGARVGRAMSGPKSSLSSEPETVSTSKPRLRGRSHQAALFIAVPASVRLVGAAPSGSVRVAMVIYALSLVGVFGASAAYHRLNWSPTALRRVRSLDHSMIFLLIAATNTAFGVLVLHGVWQQLVLVVVWTGALVGITLKLVNIDGFSPAVGTLYIALGCIGIAALPQVLSESEVLPLVLILAGGLMYAVGTFVLLRRRPDPNPLVFGYHEIWHALVVAASTCHYAAITVLLREEG